MNFVKIFLIIFIVYISKSNTSKNNSKLIFNKVNYIENNLNLYILSNKKFKSIQSEKNLLIISRFKRYIVDKTNWQRNESFHKKIQANLNKTPIEKQKKYAWDVSASNSSINKQNQLFTDKNTATSVSIGTVSYLKQINLKDNDPSRRIKTSGELKFLDAPPGGGMKVPGLKLDDGYMIFGYVSSVVAGLQTAEFSSGLFKDWLWNRLSFIQLVIQIIRVEGGIIGCLIFFMMCALALPSAVLAHTSCRCQCPCRFPSANSDTHDIPVPSPPRDYTDDQLKCRKIVLLVILDFMILMMPLGIIGMFLSNEHLAYSVGRSQEVSQTILEDLTTFVRNTHLQVHFVATTAMNQAVDAAVNDLEDVENLLGVPIQKTLTADTGIDIALDALTDICTASADIATEVLTLRAEAQAAREAAKSAQDRLKELKRQIDTAKRQCGEQDRVFCDMVDTEALEIVFNVDKLLSERKLSRLRHLGEDNLTSAVGDVRQTYQDIPQRIVRDTALHRQEIQTILRRQREVLYTSVEALEDVSRDFTASINGANSQVTQVVQAVVNVEQWRWLTGLTSSITILLIWTLVTSGVCCSHFNCTDRILPVYVFSLVLICILPLVLWTVAAMALLLGGNGEMLICRPLYDQPKYNTLTELLDNPGMVFKYGGLFSNILNGNDSLDVPIKVLLSECQLNQPIFPTFQLNRIFNIDSLTNHLTWPKLHSHFHNLSVNINDTQILKPTLQKYLQDLAAASRVNLTLYRQQLSGAVTLTDLNSFADQLERVAGQMHDLGTSARMETLAARARKLLGNNIQRVEKHRDEVVYKLTALDVHLLPLQRQANQSLSHLKTIQYYLNSQGENISKNKTSEYVTRVVKYLERFREHVLSQLTYEIAPCRPLWDAYDAARMQLCKHVVEPMNIFWISTVWCLMLFILMTPILMSLINFYKYMIKNGFISRRELNELLLSEQAPWTTAYSTPESYSTPEQQSVWTTPRRTSEQYLIPPPRLTPEALVPPTSFRRLIETHIAPRARPPQETLNLGESSRRRSMPSPRRWL